jgi:hypothetical protein
LEVSLWLAHDLARGIRFFAGTRLTRFARPRKAGLTDRKEDACNDHRAKHLARREPTMMAQRAIGQRNTDRRQHKRIALLHSASLREGERTVDCVIRDISASGARIIIERRLAQQRALVLDIAGIGGLNGRLVWQRADEAGIRFLDEPKTVKSYIAAAWGKGTELG